MSNPIEKSWQEYIKLVIYPQSKDIPDSVLEIIRETFYAGAISCLTEIIGDEPKNERKNIIGLLPGIEIFMNEKKEAARKSREEREEKENA